MNIGTTPSFESTLYIYPALISVAFSDDLLSATTIFEFLTSIVAFVFLSNTAAVYPTSPTGLSSSANAPSIPLNILPSIPVSPLAAGSFFNNARYSSVTSNVLFITISEPDT